MVDGLLEQNLNRPDNFKQNIDFCLRCNARACFLVLFKGESGARLICRRLITSWPRSGWTEPDILPATSRKGSRSRRDKNLNDTLPYRGDKTCCRRNKIRTRKQFPRLALSSAAASLSWSKGLPIYKEAYLTLVQNMALVPVHGGH